MKLATAFTYGLGAVIARGLVATEAATLRGNSQSEATPHRRLVDSTTCVQSTVVEVQHEDPSIEESYFSCETSDGMQYKVDGVPQSEVDSEKAAVANGEKEFDFPAGTTIANGKINAPHGTKVSFKKKRDKGTVGPKGGYSWSGRDRKLLTAGTKTVLVVRVIAADGTTSASQAELSDSVFGTSGDQVNLASQYNVCSDGQLIFDKAANKAGNGATISNGVTQISVSTTKAQGDVEMRNAITTALNTAFSVTSPTALADYVMYCLPAGTMSGIAYAFINSWMSVYSDNWCTYLSAQMHEVGHNLGLAHSNEAGSYKDQTGMMGFSYSQDDGPKMCFNGAKSWQLGWYQDKHQVFNLSDSSWSGRLVGHVDKGSAAADDTIILKLNTGTATDYYVSFNSPTAHNSGTVEAGNQVTVQTMGGEGTSYAESELVAKLSAGGEYVISNFDGSGVPLTLKVNEINTGASPPYAYVSVATTCTTDDDCNDGYPCNGVETCVSGSCVSGASLYDKVVQIDITTDNYAAETSWTLVHTASGTQVGSKALGSYTASNTQHSDSINVCGAQYTFTINDSYGDGICCSYGNGSYNVKYGGVTEASGGSFTSSMSHTFGTDGPVTPQPTSQPTTPNPTSPPTTGSPTPAPTKFPTKTPTPEPTNNPTSKPTTGSPTMAPSKFPTKTPTLPPTNNPTSPPTTAAPTKMPTPPPTNQPVTCTLAAVGESCRNDEDCCSGSCKNGNPSNRVCLA